MATQFDHEAVLALPLMAFLATSSPDGPRVAPVWFLWEDGALWIPYGRNASSVGRLARDPRCAVEIVDFRNEAGILRHVGLRGRASVVPMDAARFGRLLAKYLGPDRSGWNPWFIAEIARPDDPDNRMVRLAPETIFTNDVSFFRTGPALARP